MEFDGVIQPSFLQQIYGSLTFAWSTHALGAITSSPTLPWLQALRRGGGAPAAAEVQPFFISEFFRCKKNTPRKWHLGGCNNYPGI